MLFRALGLFKFLGDAYAGLSRIDGLGLGFNSLILHEFKQSYSIIQIFLK